MLLQAVLFGWKKIIMKSQSGRVAESNEIGMKRHFSVRLFMFLYEDRARFCRWRTMARESICISNPFHLFLVGKFVLLDVVFLG